MVFEIFQKHKNYKNQKKTKINSKIKCPSPPAQIFGNVQK